MSRVELSADPGEARGGSANTSVTDSFINSVILVKKKITAPSCPNGYKWCFYKANYIDIFLKESYSKRASKSLYWLKSYGDVAEWVDFAYLWSCIGKGLFSLHRLAGPIQSLSRGGRVHGFGCWC